MIRAGWPAAGGTQRMATLDGIAAGLTLSVIVQAVNGSSQGVASDPIAVTMPTTSAAAKPETVADTELAPLAAIQPNGNSTSDGNGSYAVNRLS